MGVRRVDLGATVPGQVRSGYGEDSVLMRSCCCCSLRHTKSTSWAAMGGWAEWTGNLTWQGRVKHVATEAS